MNQKISVVVCAKNSESLMEDCLKSIKLNNPDEIILIDGNSIDKTAEISKKYADMIISDEGRGLGHARQLGTSKTRNSLVAIVSPDNILPEGCLSQLAKDMEKSNFVAVETQVRVLLDDNSTYWDKCWDINLQIDLKPGERPVIGTPSLYKREAIIKYRYDDFFNAAELTDICLRWRKDGLKVGVGTAIAYEKQRLTFSDFQKRWTWYGEGDANFIWKYRNSPSIYLNHFFHPLRTYMIKRSFQAVVAGKIYAVPFLFLCGFFRYVGFARRFSVLLNQNFFIKIRHV